VLTGTEQLSARDRADTLHDILTSERIQTVERLRKLRRDAEFALDAALGELGGLRERIRTDQATLELARTTVAQGNEAIPRLREQAVIARPTANVVGTDLPLVTFEAYFRGARAAAEANPGCNIAWPLLAGIGQIESRHGTFRGRRVLADGTITEPIIGIPLDGTNNTREILDSDGGLLDTDPVYDRAVGPMQFIPTTWAAFGTDGNGDGIADPHHFFDAARSAGEYLCRAGDLSDPAVLDRAILSYNRSFTYRDTVLANMAVYETYPLR
jgi:membrane-bound lytic murein transglycosylase B